jgi:ribose-phosphate pyrophosphokinase
MIYFNGREIVSGKFPNGENQFFNLVQDISKVNYIEVVYESNEDLFNLAIVKKWFDDYAFNDSIVNLIMPFCPYGQSDRIMEDKMFTFKYFAKFINSLNFNKVIISDPHSNVMAAALDRCIVIYPMECVNVDNYDLFFYVDAGGCKKYSEIYPNIPYRYGNKKRDLNTGKIIKYEVVAEPEDIEGKAVLIRDDLVIGGRSFKEAALALHNMGAKRIDLYITHLMPPAEDFYKHHKDFYIDNFYSDNTLQQSWFKNPIE